MRHVHAAAIRAQAEAELSVLRGWPQPARCRAGAHVGGPGCHEHQVDHEQPATGADAATHLAALAAAAALPRYRAGLHAIPFEVWAAQR